jgi:hypothetical protein
MKSETRTVLPKSAPRLLGLMIATVFFMACIRSDRSSESDSPQVRHQPPPGTIAVLKRLRVGMTMFEVRDALRPEIRWTPRGNPFGRGGLVITWMDGLQLEFDSSDRLIGWKFIAHPQFQSPQPVE